MQSQHIHLHHNTHPKHTHLHDNCWVSATLALSPFLKFTLHSKHILSFYVQFVSPVLNSSLSNTQTFPEATCSHTLSLSVLSDFPLLAFHLVPPNVTSSNWPHPLARTCLHTHPHLTYKNPHTHSQSSDADTALNFPWQWQGKLSVICIYAYLVVIVFIAISSVVSNICCRC